MNKSPYCTIPGGCFICDRVFCKGKHVPPYPVINDRAMRPTEKLKMNLNKLWWNRWLRVS